MLRVIRKTGHSRGWDLSMPDQDVKELRESGTWQASIIYASAGILLANKRQFILFNGHIPQEIDYHAYK